MREKPIYETHSLFRGLHIVGFRLFCLIIIASAYVNYSENVAVTTLSIILFSTIFIFVGQGSIIVYADRIEREWSYTLSLIGIKQIYFYKDIQSISINGMWGKLAEAVTDVGGYVRPIRNKIYIVFNDERQKIIRTRIYKSELNKAMKYFLEAFKNFKSKN